MATPAVVDYIGTTAHATIATQTWHKRLPNPSVGGETIVVAFAVGHSGATITASDDQSNTYTGTTQINDAGNNQCIRVFYAYNIAANTQQVTADSGSTYAFNELYVIRINNTTTTDPLDGQSGRTTTGTSLSTGTWTTSPAADGNMLLHFALLDGFAAQSTTMTWTAGTGTNATMALLCCNSDSYMACEYGIQSTHASTTTAITSSINASGAIVKSVAFKAGTGGSTATLAGLKVCGVSTQTLENSNKFATYSGTAYGFDVPVLGNAIALGWTGRPPDEITSVTSSPALTWQRTDTPSVSGGSGNVAWWWFAFGATPGTTYRVTVNLVSSPPQASVQNFIDFMGTDYNSYDKYANASGTDTTIASGSSGTINEALIKPYMAGELLLTMAQEDRHTVTNMSPGTCLSVDIGVYAQTGGETDQGLGMYYAPTAASVQMVLTYSGYEAGGGGPGAYCSQTVAFKPAGSPIMGSVGTIYHPGMGPGNVAAWVKTEQSYKNYASVASVIFRKTLSVLGNAIGSRKKQH